MSPAGPGTVHVNSLRWFASTGGGAEFVRAHGDELDHDTLSGALSTPYPDARHVLAALHAAGVGADRLFSFAGDDPAEPARASADDSGRNTDSGATETDSATSAGTDAAPRAGQVSLGGLALAVDSDRDRVAPDSVVTGLSCTAPDPDAIPRAAHALADAFGPQVVWADDLADVMLVRPGMTLDQVRERWTRGPGGNPR